MAFNLGKHKVEEGRYRQSLRLLIWVWIAFLAWIVIGGTIGEVLNWTRDVGPFCMEDGSSETYPPCEPCHLNTSVFGVIDVSDCPNAVVKYSLEYGISYPRVFVIILTLFVYVLADFLYQFSRFLPTIILIPAVTANLFRTLYVNFIRNKNIERGLHRGLLAAWLLLATLLAVQW